MAGYNNFSDRWLASIFRGREYREGRPWDNAFLVANAPLWQNLALGRRRGVNLGIPPFQPDPVVRPVPAVGAIGNANLQANTLRQYFGGMNWLTQDRILRSGGFGFAIKWHRGLRPGDPTRPFDFVVKVALSSYSLAIRNEHRETMRFKRSAHCIQEIDFPRIGHPVPYPWRFDIPNSDDSSPAYASSGDASRADRPPQPRRFTALQRARRRIRMRHRIRGATQLYGLRTQVIYGRPQRAGALTATNANHNDLWQQDRKDMLFLECCQNGDLQTLLYRLHEDDENKNIPMRVLYAFWLCLIRACVALQYPPRKFHPKRTHAAPPVVNGQPGFDDSVGTKVVGTDLFEDIPPPRRRWDKKRNVHFDIDPKNIFIADLDANTKDEEHRLIPRIKLADFGLHEQIKPDKTNLYYLRRRFTGKPLYWAPEQFGADWDSIRSPFRDAPRGNGREVSTQRIAGNYNAPMNVWGVALVMWQLITKADPPFPPRSQAQNGQHANLPRNYCELLLEPKRYDHIDLEFRRTIARCMAHNPRERPLLQDLLKQAKRWIKVRAGERDRVVDQWVQDNIFNA